MSGQPAQTPATSLKSLGSESVSLLKTPSKPRVLRAAAQPGQGSKGRAAGGAREAERRYLRELDAHVFLPAFLWRRLRKEHPVGPAGQGAHQGQVPAQTQQ